MSTAVPANPDHLPTPPLNIETELKESYLTYAMSVIVSRALPDVRDGLKPSQRRILMAMLDLGLTPGGSTSKCAGIVGETMKRYHPHGDNSIYPTLARMAQWWNMRHLLITGQGNFGSIHGLPPAAMRYTEAKLSPVAAEMLEDIRLDTVDFQPSYDEKHQEPRVLPAKFPNLLVNGSGGIAVGMATSIPPHNLGEVCDAAVALIDDPEIDLDGLMEHIHGPDFPTGGTICGRWGIREAYRTGRGKVILRAKYEIEELRDGRSQIIFTEIPYQLTKEPLLKKLAELVNGDRVNGVTDIVDESDRKQPVRIVVKVKKGEDPNVILNQLYQYSPLQDSFSVIMLALVDGRPEELPLKRMLRLFVDHRVNVIRRRTQFQLRQARQRAHIVEGLLIALAYIDEIIRVIRSSANPVEARARLMGMEVSAEILRRALDNPDARADRRPDPDAGRRDPRHEAPAAHRPGGRQAGRRVHRAPRRHRQLRADPRRRAPDPRPDPRRPPRDPAEVRQRPPVRHRPDRAGRLRQGSVDPRGVHGRHRHPRRLHQAAPAQHLPGPDPGRPGDLGHQHQGG